MARGEWAGVALLAILPLAAARAAVDPPLPQIDVPGGIPAIARVLGAIDQDPERFVESLNGLLLSATRADHDWESIPKRADLVRLLDLVAELRQRFPGEIRLGPGPKERPTAVQLADLLGFALEQNRRHGFVLAPKGENNREQALRRAAAQALDLELDRMADRLDAGESWTVTIPAGRARLPVTADVWQRITGQPLGPDALRLLAEDQPSSLLLDGLDHLSAETRAAVERMDLRSLHDRAPFAFRRYAPAFVVENGRLAAPGGAGAISLWRDAVRAPDPSPPSLIRALLETDRARGAYLWHTLHFADPGVQAWLTSTNDASGRPRWRRALEHLDGDSGAFESAQAGESGLDVFTRSMPVEGDPPGLRLPGGPALWRAAIEGDRPPATREELRAIVERAASAGGGGAARNTAANETADTDFLLDAVAGADRDSAGIARRLARGANLFLQHPELYSAENVVLVTRGAEAFPAALAALDVMDLRSPDVARDYLLAVARLHRLDLDAGHEQLLLAFQGGVEWLRAMAMAERVEPSVLERALASWSEIHAHQDGPAGAAPEELEWVAGLLRALPPAPEDAPGRGPIERAMLQAMVARAEPGFSWQGLDYDSDLPRRAAAGMAAALAFFEITDADRLAAMAASPSDSAARRLAGELRSFLVAPAYLVPLAEGGGSLLQDRDLVRKHRLACDATSHSKVWSTAELERGETNGIWFCGHLGTVDEPIARFALSAAELRTGRGLDPPRSQAWFHHWIATRWARLDPPSSAAVAATMDLGRAVLGLATREAIAGGAAPHLALAERFVPRARLEDAAAGGDRAPSLLSPSEALLTGLAVLAPGAASGALVGADEGIAGAATGALAGVERELAAARAATGALGPRWRERLAAAAGVATPALDGKASPWLGWWPPYEAVERDRRSDALIEREIVDLHLRVVAEVGRRGLPGYVASNLMRRTMEHLAGTIQLADERDWQSVLRALDRLDQTYFEARLRECLSDGLYRLREP